MRAKGPALRTLGIVVFILLLLGVSFGLFSYSYVSGKQDYLTKRDFRALGALGTQLKLKIENYGSKVLMRLPTMAAAECDRDSNDPCQIRVLPQEARKLLASKTRRVEGVVQQGAEKPRDLSQAGGDPRLKEKVKKAQDEFTKSLKRALFLAPNLKLNGEASVFLGEGPTTVRVLPPHQGDSSQLSFEYSGPVRDPVRDEGYRVMFRVMAKWDDLVGTFGKNVFDNIMIVSTTKEENTVIFQQALSGPQITKLLLVRDRKGIEVPFANIRSSSDVFGLNFAGTEYKVFLQPLRFSTITRYSKGVPINETNYGGDWTVCGLVQADRFRTESLAISYTVLLSFLFIFVLVTASWPLLKLWSLGPSDRLGLADVVFVSISVLMISGLLTFFLADLYAYVRMEDTFDSQLQEFADGKELGDPIVERFESEVERLRSLLAYLDGKMSAGPSEATRTGILTDFSLDWKNFSDVYFEIVSQTDKDGTQVRKWTIKDRATPLISVAERDYFRKIRDGQGWSPAFSDAKSSGQQDSQFWLEPIISWNTGEILAELSMSSSGDPAVSVVSLTAKLISLRNTVVPPGFGYAVIDDGGKVLFHSDLSRTLVEDFIEECERDRGLRAHIHSRTSEWINASYMGKGHRLYVTPFKELPWTLVVFRDKEIARTANLELLSASLILYIFYGLVFLLPVLLFCLWHSEWMWPDEGRLADYEHLLLANVLLIALSLTEFFSVPHHHVPFLAFLLPPFALLLTCLKLKEGTHSSRWKRSPFFLLLMALPPLLLLIRGLWDSVAGPHGGRLGLFVIVQALALYGIFVFVFYPQEFFFLRLRESPKNRPRVRLSASGAYVLVGVSLVAIISVLPALVFFRSGHDSEMEILAKHGQFHLAHSLVVRDERVKEEYRGVSVPPGYLKNRLNERRDIYAGFFFDTQFNAQNPEARECFSEEHFFEQVMEKIRPIYNEVAVETHELVHDATADCSFQWVPGQQNIELAKAPAALANFLPMKSGVPVLRWPGKSWWWFGVAAAILLITATIYWLVRFVAKTIFLLDLFLPCVAAAEVTELREVVENTLVLGMPHSGKSELLGQPEFLRVDIRRIAAAGTWEEALNQEVPQDRKVVAMDHLEYAMDDPECNGQKLRLLEKFLYANRTLVVTSTADPIDFSVDAPNGRNRKGAGEEKLPQEEHDRLASQYMDRWAGVWSTFTRRVYATKKADAAIEEKELKDTISHAEFSPVVAVKLLRECKPTERLRRIGIEIAGLLHRGRFSDKQVIAEVLDRARAYYRALWATCSREEKLALLDLAQDGFVNAKSHVLRRLVERGLVVRNPRLRPMNESFRQFVINTGVSEGAGALQGTEWSPWSVIRGTLVAVAIGVALIVFLTQRELLNLSTTFIGAVSAGIPALLKLFNLFRGGHTNE